MSDGWIMLHRKLKNHWIWKSNNRLKWWIDLLISVNHSHAKVLIKGSLVDCHRGQSVKSLDSWAKDWSVSKKTVRDFFKLLEKDSMLVYENIKVSTRITICNYDSYNNVVNATETQSKRKVNATETQSKRNLHTNNNEEKRINNENNEKEIKQIKNLPPPQKISLKELKLKKEKEFKSDFWEIGKTLSDTDQEFWSKNDFVESKRFCDYWTESKPKGKKLRFELEKTFDIKKRMATWKNNHSKFNGKEKQKSGPEILTEKLNAKYYGEKNAS